MDQEVNSTGTAPKRDRGGLIKALGLGVVLALIVWLIYENGWLKYLTIEHLALNREFLQTYIKENFVLALMIYMGIYIIAVAVSFPGATFLTVSGGLLFGWLLGGLATVVAATIGASIIFLIVRVILTMLANSSMGAALSSKVGPNAQKLQEGFQKDALSYMLFLRLVPVFPFLLVNIAPAVLGVKLTTFFIGTFFGIIPGTLAFSYAGVALDKTIDSQLGPYQECLASGAANCAFAFSPKDLLTWELITAFVLLALVSLIPVVMNKIKNKG